MADGSKLSQTTSPSKVLARPHLSLACLDLPCSVFKDPSAVAPILRGRFRYVCVALGVHCFHVGSCTLFKCLRAICVLLTQMVPTF